MIRWGCSLDVQGQGEERGGGGLTQKGQPEPFPVTDTKLWFPDPSLTPLPYQNAPRTIGGSVNWYGCSGNQYGCSFWKWKIKFLYDPAISLLGIYLEKTLIQKDTCTPMFTAALFATAKTWKQLKCPSTDEWFKKMCIHTHTHTHIHTETMEYYSAWKRIKLENTILGEVRRKMTILYNITYMWNLKNNINKSIYKTVADLQT